MLYESLVKSNRLALMWAVPFGDRRDLFCSDLVRFVLGERWRPAVVLLQVYGVTAAINHVGFNWTAYFRAIGRTRPIAVGDRRATAVFIWSGSRCCWRSACRVRRRHRRPGAGRAGAARLLPAAAVPRVQLPAPRRPGVPAHAPGGGRGAGGARAGAARPDPRRWRCGELTAYVVVTVAATAYLESPLLREAVGRSGERPGAVDRPECVRAVRILWVGNRYPPWSVGGYETIWAAAVRALRAAGHPMRVLTTVPDPTDRAGAGAGPPRCTVSCAWYWRAHAFPPRSLRECIALERGNAEVLSACIRAWRPDAIMWWAMGGMSLSLLEQAPPDRGAGGVGGRRRLARLRAAGRRLEPALAWTGLGRLAPVAERLDRVSPPGLSWSGGALVRSSPLTCWRRLRRGLAAGRARPSTTPASTRRGSPAAPEPAVALAAALLRADRPAQGDRHGGARAARAAG